MALVPSENEKYELLEVIGRGAFGIIRKVRRKNDQQILCRKEINYLKMSTKERDQLQAEFNILSSLKNPHIVQYYHREHIKQTQELYMYMEYCGGGDLGTVIKQLKQQGKMAKEEFVWRVLSQLLVALYRCHYGSDPPEPGDSARIKDSKLGLNRTTPTILHRDLKPENIFLDHEKGVKLGDFGLSKIMQAHDFASTYVGTPFYMSPEICQAERYTAKSDIWALGCILHELCTLEPPFNATTHIQLVNKIRKGETASLPADYSKELGALIKSCLQTNPMYRPDTEALLNHSHVWLSRKQQEYTKMCKSVTSERDMLLTSLKRLEDQVAVLETEKVVAKSEVEAKIRREWEVRARLEIDRQVENEVQAKLDVLRAQFEDEVSKRVREQMAKHVCNPAANVHKDTSNPVSVNLREYHNHHSSVTTSEESEWTNTTDLTELSDLSIQSPNMSTTKQPVLKKTKTPFTRSKTTFDSPADIQMCDPSPIAISSLNLSPRRHTLDANSLCGKNLFSKIAKNKARMNVPSDLDEDEKEDDLDYSDDDDDTIPDLPSPTRPKMQNTDPFKMPPPSQPLASKAARPHITRQHTIATSNKLSSRPNLFPSTGASSTANAVRASIASAGISVNIATSTTYQSHIPRSATDGDIGRNRIPSSPTQPASRNRRLSKIPSRGDMSSDTASYPPSSTSPLRRAATTSGNLAAAAAATSSSKLQSKLASARSGISDISNNVVAGRTRVELAQARAGGRPVSADLGNIPTLAPTGKSWNRDPHEGGIRVVEKELPPVPIWDPEILGEDAMPSPFLKRDTRTIRSIR